jgi:hypothetical protein
MKSTLHDVGDCIVVPEMRDASKISKASIGTRRE